MKQLIAIKTIILLAVIAIIALSSCSTSKVVYEKGNSKWSTGGKSSSMTGWNYEAK
jgi:hypothetical protein